MAKNQEKKEDRIKQGSLRWLWQMCRGNRKFLVLLTLLQIVLNTASICYSLLFRDLIDRAVGGQLSGFYSGLIMIISLTAGRILIQAILRFLEEFTCTQLENRMKSHFFGLLLRKNYASVTAVHNGEWMNRLNSDAVLVAGCIPVIIPNICGMAVRMAGAFIMILMMAPVFGVLIVPIGIAALAGAMIARPGLKERHRQVQQTGGRIRILMQERLDNQLIIRAFFQQERSVMLADHALAEHQKARIRKSNFSNLYACGFSSIMQGLYLSGAVVGCVGIMKGTITFGTMTALLQLISLLQSPLSQFSGYFGRWYSMIASIERLREVEKMDDHPADPLASREKVLDFYENSFAGLAFRDVSFSYCEHSDGDGQKSSRRITIENLNLQISKGEIVGIMGPSGCGKSTLLKLLMGVYSPEDGVISVLCSDANMERPMQPADFDLFAYVPQGNQLMSGSIRQILSFDDPERMEDEQGLWNALEIACADVFVSELPEKLDTQLGEHGSGLSEGQIQRLALARAIFSGRPILLLDESTSSLDEQTERKFLENIRTMTHQTVIFVTHRPQAGEICSRIIRF